MKKYVIYLIVFWTSLISCLKTENSPDVDQLTNERTIAELKIDSLYDLGWDLATIEPKRSLEIAETMILQAQKLAYQKGLANAYNLKGRVYKNQNEYELAEKNYQHCLKIRKMLNDTLGIASSYNNFGTIFADQSKNKEATEMYLQALKIYENKKDENGLANIYLNLGQVLSNQGNNNKGLEYYFKAESKFKKLLHSNPGNNEIYYKGNLFFVYSNISVIFVDKKDYEKGLQTYLRALRLAFALGDKTKQAQAYNGIGGIYKTKGIYKQAFYYYAKAEELARATNQKNYLAITFYNLGEIYYFQGNYRVAQKYLISSLDLLKVVKDKKFVMNNYNTLADVAYLLGDKDKAYRYCRSYIAVRDSFFSEENFRKVNEMSSLYEKEKTTKQIALYEKDKKIQGEQVARQKQLIYLSLIIVSIILFAGVFLWRAYRQKRLANTLLAKQKLEIEIQRDKIGDQKKDIEDSIHYAERIQQAVIPDVRELTKFFSDSFILFKPRDIVSGDFYWVGKRSNWLLFGLADCTGHGVPGAFMSMLGISFLNEITSRSEIDTAAGVLNELRNSIIKSLKQSVETRFQQGEEMEQKDGMDMVFCALNTDTGEMQVAGANNSLVMVSDGVLSEIKGDKMPIGIHSRMDSFTNHLIKLEKGNCLYLYSDGFQDQFGGPKGKKFGSKQLKNLLIENHQKTMLEQKVLFQETLNQWQNPSVETRFQQIDDITLMGLIV